MLLIHQFLFPGQLYVRTYPSPGKSVINLKMDALQLWNITLTGTACGNLLNLIENAYGYPKSKARIERGSYLETVKREFAENTSDVELASAL